MLWQAVKNLAKEFDLHSRFGSVVLVEFLFLKVKILFNDNDSLSYELVLNCAEWMN